MIGAIDPRSKAGDILSVYDKTGSPYGMAFYNPKSLISLRIFTRECATFDLDRYLADRIKRAVELRRDLLGLDAVTNAYRLVHDQGDGLPGLVADRFGDYIVLEFYALGMLKLADRIEKLFAEHFPAAKFVRRATDYTQTMEGFSLESGGGGRTRIEEHGVRFEVDLTGGYKTGFFCDQRDNRMAAAAFAKGKNVLDLFSYTGGFGLYAKKLGGASEVSCVELDADVCDTMLRNANINQLRLDVVNADAFTYLRQMIANKKTFGLVVLDPYKLIASREGWEEGRHKYVDLNRLALSVVEPGGVFVTCSCSGLLSMEEFQKIVRQASGGAGRRVQIFRKSGAGPDHPFSADMPEGEYLKAIWCRVP